ncbi:MAG TPA: hypothetical protein VI413_11910 [Paludibacter sp.]
MNKTVKNKIHSAFGWLLLVLFVGILVMKPAHILVSHHNLPGVELVNTHHNTLSNRTHQECSICDFEFYNFIPQDKIQIPQAKIFLSNGLAALAIACFVSQTSHLFQLRAPPVL